jgi:hypothetical protein
MKHNDKYGSVNKGRTAEQLANFKKDFSGSKSKAIHTKMGKKEHRFDYSKTPMGALSGKERKMATTNPKKFFN